ncbi:hypothetical protein C8R43DRAFT_946026 [Mycena crocata]|nr:hypothetical protein C8R43DRAFT_946026 [Mycena crocata]
MSMITAQCCPVLLISQVIAIAARIGSTYATSYAIVIVAQASDVRCSHELKEMLRVVTDTFINGPQFARFADVFSHIYLQIPPHSHCTKIFSASFRTSYNWDPPHREVVSGPGIDKFMRRSRKRSRPSFTVHQQFDPELALIRIRLLDDLRNPTPGTKVALDALEAVCVADLDYSYM